MYMLGKLKEETTMSASSVLQLLPNLVKNQLS